MTQQERILVLSHAHPDFSLGGGEIAAYNSFRAYLASDDVEDAWFLARVDRGHGATGRIHLRRDREYLWEQGVGDWALRSAHRDSVRTWFADLLRATRPTVIHAHHYTHLGLDFLRVVKDVLPQTRVYLTLHEFVAICANNGQMVKTNGRLCRSESLEDCHRCFPHRSMEDFWLRKNFILNHFALVDGFIAPSAFLRDRYVDWGVEPDRIVVIENGQGVARHVTDPPEAVSGRRARFGFFGQVHPYKGLDVVLEAIASLPKGTRKRLVLEVHGANLENQDEDFVRQITNLREPLIKEGVVRWVGPYEPQELSQRMAGVDWVVVPSRWWENSPMVIQEAFVNRRPPIVSNIGGMAEKVRDGVDGIHVPVSNPLAWADTIERLVAEPGERDRLAANIVAPLSHAECASRHLALFSESAPA